MSTRTDRRNFIRQGTAFTAGLIATATPPIIFADRSQSDSAEGSADAKAESQTPAAENEPPPAHHDQQEHDGRGFPRMQAGRGGPIGSPTDRGKLVSGYRSVEEPPASVLMPDLTSLDWEMKDGAKEFHLVAEHVRREILPDVWFDFWGFNGSMPGPVIAAVQGDRVRIVVHNSLPEATTVHWHGLELPNAMDGVPGLTQDPIPPGGTFAYEFDLHQDGTFFYHSHGGMQEVMGMLGLFVIHPQQAYEPVVDHDFGLIVQEFAVLPQSTIPNSVSEDFNFFTINGRSGPYVTPLVVRLGSRVRIRFMNLSAMDHHPMHLHGHTFWVTGNEAGRIPDSAWIPANNVLVGVGQSRDVEFVANNPGDWMIHCHIPHHMMNHMVSMAGPMPTADYPGITPNLLGEELASGTLGAGLEPSLGPATSDNRPVMTGMRPSSTSEKISVPGYPQDMLEMHGMMTPEQRQKISIPLTRGMRRNWPMGVMAMMTTLRVLPDELFEQVVSGAGDIEPGASVPGGGPGAAMDHSMHGGHQGTKLPPQHDQHNR